MGKRRKMGLTKKPQRADQGVKINEDTTLDPSSRDFVYDEVDQYNDDREDAVLREVVFSKRKPVEKQQVLGVGGDTSESDEMPSEDSEEEEDKLFMEDDDIVDPKVDTLPDERMWGKKRSMYFGTDTTDEKLRRQVTSDKWEEMARVEEEAIDRLQERLNAPIHDLLDDIIPAPQHTSVKEVDTSLSTEATPLTEKQKKRQMKQQFPEFFPLTQDLEEKCAELKDVLKPLIQAYKKGELINLSLARYVITRQQLLSTYVMNISAYLLLKCEITNVSRHPVIHRLKQYRSLIQKMEPVHEKINSRLVTLATKWKAGKSLGLKMDPEYEIMTKKSKSPKMLKLFNKGRDNLKPQKRSIADMLEDSDEKNIEKEEEGLEQRVNDSSSDDADEGDEEPKAEETGEEDKERRGITYQMSKNKGLIPSRRKDQQNPRVKYRMKYTKKLKMRKGQVRQVRNEEKKYSGEKSGINVRAVKSTKFK